ANNFRGLPSRSFVQGLLKKNPLNTKTFRSPVSGVVEKILPDGTVVVREKEERAHKLCSVKVAEHLDVSPEQIVHYIKCEVGQDIDIGQVLARKGLPHDPDACKSPVRGRIKDINLKFGIVIIEPLQEELELTAWIPGRVVEITGKGCVIINTGTTVQGVWGQGEEAFGPLALEGAHQGAVVVRDMVVREDLQRFAEVGIAALITAGLHLKDVNELKPPFSIVVMGCFGEQKLIPELSELFRSRTGKHAAVDPFTQLRAGVSRPSIILIDD
ncbi:MAG: hypothetical protein DRP45_10695, partial [Candidatus Zixiibacteriota bacterium]